MGSQYNSDRDSDEGSRSGSRTPIAAPTPGFSLEHHDPRSRSNSAGSNRSGSAASRSRSGSRHSGSRRSGSRTSRRSGSRQSGSQHSGSRHSGSRRSGSIRSGSRHSGSRSGSDSRSPSGSRRSGSQKSGSHRSGSAASNKSRSRSGSPKSPSRSRSGSPVTASAEKRKRAVLSDSGSDAEPRPQFKKSGLIDSDSDEPEKPEGDEPKEGITADAIFGDDVSDISTDDEARQARAEKAEQEDARRSKTPERARSRSRSRSSDGQNFERVYQQMSDEEKQQEPEPEPIPETRIDVEIPRIVTNLGRDIHFVKMPNFLSVETRPFDVDTYEDEIDEEDVMDEEGRQRLKLKVGNTIRWREIFDSDGRVKRESNARIVKWSDGSMSLHLGSEIFDVYKQPLTGDHNHLFIRQGTGLQGQAVFRSKLTFRPHSTESFTHKKMTISLADRSQKTSGIKILTQVGHDPDADRTQKLKTEEEKLRQAMRAKPGASKVPKRSSGAANASYRDHDEASDDEGAISIAAIKGKYKKDKKQSASAIYSSDEEGSDIDSRRKKKGMTLKALDDDDGGSSDGGSASGSRSGSGNEKSGSAGSGDDNSD